MLVERLDDDDDVISGYPRMAAFAADEGLNVSLSTIRKQAAPSVGKGPELIGYFGQLPTTTKGRMRAWLRAKLRTERPPTRPGARPALPLGDEVSPS